MVYLLVRTVVPYTSIYHPGRETTTFSSLALQCFFLFVFFCLLAPSLSLSPVWGLGTAAYSG
jgi:hypothetical protein